MAGELRKLRFLRGSIHLILAWPVVCVMLGLLMWAVTQSRLAEERNALQREAFKDAAAMSRAYAEQLSSVLTQVDQTTLTLKHYWEDTSGRVSLERQSQLGLYAPSSLLHVTIVDRHGRMRTSTRGMRSGSVAERDYFQAHANDPGQGLRISGPFLGIFTRKPGIIFSRRLDAADGSFDGVVIVAVAPRYLASFHDAPRMGESALLEARSKDHVLYAASADGSEQSPKSLFRRAPAFESGSGIVAMQGDQFVDNQSRIVAWQSLKAYPLVSIVGLSEREVFSDYEAKARDYRNLALAATVILVLGGLIGVLVTARLAWRKQQEQEVRDTYRLAIDGAREGFYMLRAIPRSDGSAADFIVEDCNERGGALLGRTRETLIGARISELYQEAHSEQVLGILRHAMQAGFYEEEFRVARSSPERATWVSRKLTRSGSGLAMTLRDISKLKAHEEALSVLANQDAVTRLPNRHWLMNYLPAAVELARSNKTLLALLFVDLDDFKNINDTLGHAAGDELLQAVAFRLKAVVRPQDSVVRLGGDEFTIVLERLVSDNDVPGVASRIIKSLGEPFVLSGGSSHAVQASVGISMFPQDGEDGDALLKHADIAMYAAKSNGKGQYRFYEPQLSKTLLTRLDKERLLRQAIDNDEFVLYFQPRVDTYSGELRSLEALVRWNHPELGLVAPQEFIPTAEDTGLIVELGELVIRKAFAQLAQWKEQKLPVVPVSINVSPRQFWRPGLAALFASCMAQHGIEPSLVEMEITESSMFGEDNAVTDELAEIEALGITLLVDDFGTGYSSLSQLQRLDLDVLKVDRAFTARLCDGKEGEAFFMAILSMAHVLDMTVVAEGVETPQELQILQALSCDEVQGYLISPPVPAAQAPALMVKRFLFPAQIQARPSRERLS